MGSVSATSLANTPQPKFHHDNQNTGQSQYKGPQTNAMSMNITHHIDDAMTIGSDGTIYIGSAGYYPNGTERYSFYTSGEVRS